MPYSSAPAAEPNARKSAPSQMTNEDVTPDVHQMTNEDVTPDVHRTFMTPNGVPQIASTLSRSFWISCAQANAVQHEESITENSRTRFPLFLTRMDDLRQFVAIDGAKHNPPPCIGQHMLDGRFPKPRRHLEPIEDLPDNGSK